MRIITTRACIICQAREPDEPQDAVLNVLEAYEEPKAGVIMRKRDDMPPKLQVKGAVCRSCYETLLGLPQ
jgi:hypothetical protein